MKLTEAQEQWLDALESGNYKQARQRLRVGDSYCCLGVASDLYPEGKWHASTTVSPARCVTTRVFYLNQNPRPIDLHPLVR